MKVAVIGTGYVGLVCGTCLAELGNNVICADVAEDKINGLKQGIIPIYEPGLEEMLNRNYKEGRLKFTCDIPSAVRNSYIIFIAVGTPPKEDGVPDLSQVYKAATDVAIGMDDSRIIVIKSTVLVGTAFKVREIIESKLAELGRNIEFDVLSNPEFLKEGAAIEDFMKPDRIVIGTESEKAAAVMQELYKYFVRNGHPVFIMDTKSSEMTKYAANAILASRISFINEIANICEGVGADIESVRKGMGGDSRIGYKFLNPGPGFGGSCFPKDLKALIYLAKSAGVQANMLESIVKVNEIQKQTLVRKIIGHFGDKLEGLTFAIWGLTFKPRTNDMRESPSITLINALRSMNASVRAFDPVGMEEAEKVFNDPDIYYAEDSYECLEGADALVIVTEWSIFRNPDFDLIKAKLRKSVIFDGRNIYNKKEMAQLGIKYYSIGR